MNLYNSYFDKKTTKKMEVLYSKNIEAIRQCLSTEEGMDNINNEDNGGTAPLYHACSHNRNDVVDVLIEYGADVNQIYKGLSLTTPLFVPCRRGYIDIVNRLLQAGADPNISDNSGRTPIMDVAETEHLNIVKLLTIYTDFNTMDMNGDTIFTCAIWSNNNDMIDYVFDYCTDINHMNNDGWSYLHGAVYESNKYAISLLLKKGIDIHIENNKGKKAIDLTQDPEIIALLRSA